MPNSARPFASLTVSFGLVAIPVKLYSAIDASGEISFHLVRKKDGSRVRMQYVAVADGEIVERADMVKGYEFAKNQYVLFNPEEMKAFEEASSRSIDIVHFVPLESVDPIYFEGTYYLAPDKGGGKPYTLLATALRKSAQCAIGRWISRGKEHMVTIRAMQDGLAMHPLHFQAELRDLKELDIASAPVSEAELELAQRLIEQLKEKQFDPGEYVDEFKQRVEAAIRRKVEGQEVSLSETAASPARSNVIDLMEALRASIDGPARSGATPRDPKAAKRAIASHAPRKTARR